MTNRSEQLKALREKAAEETEVAELVCQYIDSANGRNIMDKEGIVKRASSEDSREETKDMCAFVDFLRVVGESIQKNEAGR